MSAWSRGFGGRRIERDTFASTRWLATENQGTTVNEIFNLRGRSGVRHANRKLLGRCTRAPSISAAWPVRYGRSLTIQEDTAIRQPLAHTEPSLCGSRRRFLTFHAANFRPLLVQLENIDNREEVRR